MNRATARHLDGLRQDAIYAQQASARASASARNAARSDLPPDRIAKLQHRARIAAEDARRPYDVYALALSAIR